MGFIPTSLITLTCPSTHTELSMKSTLHWKFKRKRELFSSLHFHLALAVSSFSPTTNSWTSFKEKPRTLSRNHQNIWGTETQMLASSSSLTVIDRRKKAMNKNLFIPELLETTYNSAESLPPALPISTSINKDLNGALLWSTRKRSLNIQYQTRLSLLFTKWHTQSYSSTAWHYFGYFSSLFSFP